MDKVVELRQRRAQITRAAAELRSAADRCAGELSRSQHKRIAAELSEADAEVAKIDAKIAAEERDRFDGGSFDAPLTQTGDPTFGSLAELTRPGSGHPDVLTREQRMSDWLETRGHRAGLGGWSSSMLSEVGDPSRFSLGRQIHGWITGQWDGDSELERRALQEGTNASGGYLLPAPLSARTIDKIRNRMRVLQAGAVAIPMNEMTLAMPRLLTDPTPEWHAESGAVTPSSETFDRVTFTAHTIDVLVKISVELFQDVPSESAALIENAIVASIALEIDRVALRGDGTGNAPTGVLHQSGVTITSLGANGATPTWDNIIDAVSTIRNNNLEPNAILWAPRTEQTLAKVKDSQGRYLEPPSAIDNVARLTTNQIPTNLTQGTSNERQRNLRRTVRPVGDWLARRGRLRHDRPADRNRQRAGRQPGRPRPAREVQ